MWPQPSRTFNRKLQILPLYLLFALEMMLNNEMFNLVHIASYLGSNTDRLEVITEGEIAHYRFTITDLLLAVLSNTGRSTKYSGSSFQTVSLKNSSARSDLGVLMSAAQHEQQCAQQPIR